MHNDPPSIYVSKALVVSAAAYLAYIGLTCPCRPHLYSCHLTQMYVALAVVVAVLCYQNGARVTNHHN